MARPFLQCHHRFKNGKNHCSWSIAEKVRTRRGWVQRHLLYLGEINDSQKAAWTKVTEVFDTEREQTRPLALYPADRAVPAHAAFHVAQFWDGRSPTIEDQAGGPIMAAAEMGMQSPEQVGLVLRSIPGYGPLFDAAFPGDPAPITLAHVARALGAFERGLTTPARFDRFLAGDYGQLSVAEQRGLATFIRVGCVTCHSGAPVGGLLFRKLGEIEPYPTEDLGRFTVTGLETDRYVFKVQSLRNIAQTGPYLHDGSIPTLEDMVRLMARHQLGRAVSDAEVNDIVTFLQTLTGELPHAYIAPPPLPESGPETQIAYQQE